MRIRYSAGWVVLLALGMAGIAHGDITGQSVSYQVGEQAFEGYYARNTAMDGEQPVVLIIHDWDGLGDYERTRARMLARLGYAAFAADLYGAGVRPQTREAKRARSGELYSDRALLRERLTAAVEQLDALEGAHARRAVAIGYCFGGSAVLELARSGADLDGFVTFHGGLGTPDDQSYANVKAPVLVLHGSADQVSPMSDVAALANALDEAGVEHRMEIYGGAPHAFTVWSGSGYRPEADFASWQELLTLLEQRF